jgi:hypothetical protein
MRQVLRMKRSVVALMALLAVGMTATAALGANAHLTKGSSISCTVTSGSSSASVTCTGTGGMAGLGNADVAFVLGGTGSATYNCQNPGNGSLSPGQNKVPFSLSPTTISVPASSVKNGNLAFFGPSGNTISGSQTAPSATATQAGCPNNNWTTSPTSVFFTSIDLQIQQPPGTTIIDCTASDPNGLTGSFTLNCAKA